MLLVAVSGGIDSMCLAEKLRLSGEAFAVAHCNFRLRGADSDADEAFVRDWAQGHGIAIHIKAFDTKAFAAAEGISVEMAARRLRYHWFGELCREHGYTAVAVAHNANDNAETLLLNLLRGTGLKGLTGMKAEGFLPDPAFGDIPLLRPLLGLTREEITAFATEHSLPWREDRTNAENDYKRNKIRNLVFPVFREINPRFIETLNRDMERFAEELGALAEGETLRGACPPPDMGWGWGPLADGMAGKLACQPSCLPVGGAGVERSGTESPRRVSPFAKQGTPVADGGRGGILQAPSRPAEMPQNGLEAVFDGLGGRAKNPPRPKMLPPRPTILPTHPEETTPRPDDWAFQPARLSVGGTRSKATKVSGICPCPPDFTIEEEPWDESQNVKQPEGMLILDADKAGELVEGRWESGDWIKPLGAPGRKKLQDWFTDHHIPADEKPFVPLLKAAADPHHVLAIVGCCIDHSVRVTPATLRILRISVKND